MAHTIKIYVYEFSELDEKAKEKAVSDHYNCFGSLCSEEFWETCKAIEKVFPIIIDELSEYSYKNRYNIEELDDDEEYKTKEEYLTRANYKEPEYALTGTYCDLYFLQALPSTGKLTKKDFIEALNTFFKEYTRAWEYEQSEEYFKELSEANEWYYFENGELAPNGIE